MTDVLYYILSSVGRVALPGLLWSTRCSPDWQMCCKAPDDGSRREHLRYIGVGELLMIRYDGLHNIVQLANISCTVFLSDFSRVVRRVRIIRDWLRGGNIIEWVENTGSAFLVILQSGWSKDTVQCDQGYWDSEWNKCVVVEETILGKLDVCGAVVEIILVTLHNYVELTYFFSYCE